MLSEKIGRDLTIRLGGQGKYLGPSFSLVCIELRSVHNFPEGWMEGNVTLT